MGDAETIPPIAAFAATTTGRARVLSAAAERVATLVQVVMHEVERMLDVMRNNGLKALTVAEFDDWQHIEVLTCIALDEAEKIGGEAQAIENESMAATRELEAAA